MSNPLQSAPAAMALASDTSPLGTTCALYYAMLFAGVGGMLDGFTYVGHNHVFANTMTANVVLLSVNVVATNWLQAFRHLVPIVSFFLGISTATAIGRLGTSGKRLASDVWVLSLEIGVFACLGCMPASTSDMWVTIPLCFAASVQTATFRHVEGYSYNSTFTTGNLRTLSESLFAYIFEGRRADSAHMLHVFAFICASFTAGVVAGALLTPHLHNKTLWCACLLLCIPLGRRLGLKPRG